MTSFCNILIINREQKIPLRYSGHVCNPCGVHVVHVLEGGTLVTGYHLHQRAGSLGAAQHEPEALLALVQHALARQT